MGMGSWALERITLLSGTGHQRTNFRMNENMRVFYHGTTPELAQKFASEGIDANILYERKIHGPQDDIPGIYVTPKISVARRFGTCVLRIKVGTNELSVPPNFSGTSFTLDDCLNHSFEPQAFLSSRVEPTNISIVECYPNGYPFNPYDKSD